MVERPYKYRCACCGDTFVTTRSDREAYDEAVHRFGREAVDAGPIEQVCDDCAQLIYQWIEEQQRRAH